MVNDVAKDAMSGMAEFAVIDYGMVLRLMTYSYDKLRKAIFSFLPQPVDCKTEVGDVSFKEKVGDMMKSLRLFPNEVSRGNYFRIREGWKKVRNQ